MPPDRVDTLATDILVGIQSIFDDADIDLPARQYVHAGAVAIDCEQLVVQVPRLFVGTTLAEIDFRIPRHQVGIVADTTVWLIRCIPGLDAGGNPPTAEALDTSAEALLTDAFVLMQGLIVAERASSLFTEGCSGFAIGSCEPYGPEGGFGGWSLGLRVQL